MARVNPRRWFLPDTPDVMSMLRRQLAVTIEGADLLAVWAGGGPIKREGLNEIEQRGEEARRELLDALREAFITPIEPEDLYSMSRATGWILHDIGDLVGEAEVLRGTPDQGIAGMSGLLAKALREIDKAVADLGSSGSVESGNRASGASDVAVETIGRMQTLYYSGMAATLDLENRNERIARRELYRRCTRIGDRTTDLADRVIYSVVKQS
jgi:uncharacterized protein Yka (UPF0111/DUF47 family)